ncbi:hypothetical protein FJY93_01060 [Candidatus Kaiserbacteria bacterium]|nr:hypothetical protein [Candidatus Kaiserbacteria bacterium]
MSKVIIDLGSRRRAKIGDRVLVLAKETIKGEDRGSLHLGTFRAFPPKGENNPIIQLDDIKRFRRGKREIVGHIPLSGEIK